MSFQPKSQIILARAAEHLKNVPYKVSARWLFYRLLQDGTFPAKDSYKKFLSLISKARKEFYGDWNPSVLSDETRQAVYRHGDYITAEEWFQAMGENRCSLNEWYHQPNYVEIWFEAQAMQEQFLHYTSHVTLRPFRGDPSIPYKWDIAQKLKQYSSAFQNPITILYFGDYDKKGLQIPESALSDIRDWCDVDFNFCRCGLSLEQVEKYGIPENPEKPGEFQWEAVPDKAAEEIITASLSPYLDNEKFQKTKDMENEATKLFQQKIGEIDFYED
jgi:hypothetical protein